MDASIKKFIDVAEDQVADASPEVQANFNMQMAIVLQQEETNRLLKQLAKRGY